MLNHNTFVKSAAAIAGALAFTAALVLPGGTAAAEAPLDLGVAESFVVLAGTGVTNTGPSVIDGDLGTCPTIAVTGFPPGVVINGAIHANDALACSAQSDLVIAYDDAAARAPLVSFPGPTDLGGSTLVSGVYMSPTSLAVTGTVSLDAQGDPNAVFIFQAGSTVVTASNSSVALLNGAQACNVYWQVGSSATLGTGTVFVGNVLALTSITATTNATIAGRLLARNGAVTLDSNVITAPLCATIPTTTTSEEATTTTSVVVPPTTTTSVVVPATTTTSVVVPPTTTTSVVVPPTTTTSVVPATTTTLVIAPTTTTTPVVPVSTSTTVVIPAPTTSTTVVRLVSTPTTVGFETPRGFTTTTALGVPTTTPPGLTTVRSPRLPETGMPLARFALLGLAAVSFGYAMRRPAPRPARDDS
jgi:hypothetical protein